MKKSGSQFRRRLAVYLVISGFLVLLAGGGFAAFESQQVSSYGEGLWWALSLMTTVGFVGESPESLVGRLASSVLMVAGFALMALVTAAIASLFVQEGQEPGDQAEQLFDAQALGLLADIVQRLAVIEESMAAAPHDASASSEDPPSDQAT